MRTLSGQNAAVEALGERSTRVRVSIDRTGAGGWVDLSDYLDLDWIAGVEYEDNAELPVGTATVMLHRQWNGLTLSPMMAQSRLNATSSLVWPKREVKIEVAVMPRGVSAVAADWFEVFRGRIDKIDWQASPITLKCRDLGGDLQDGWVESQAIYGTGAGRAIETVIQDVLDDASTGEWIPYAVTLYSKTGSSGTPFEVADSPGFLITEYKQGREPIMDVVQKLARLIGWECRYRWSANDNAFRLTFYEPARAVRSRGTITLTGDPSAAETFQIDSVTYTARASGAVADEFNISTGDTTATALAIAAMLNDGTGAANINAWPDGATVLIEWQEQGIAGDSVTFTESMTNATMDGSGTLGGTRSGVDPVTVHTFAPSQVLAVESLSIEVTDVRNKFSGTFATAAGERTTITRRNQESIDKYHARPFILTEASSGPIDTIEEMADMLGAADNDLSEPDIGQGVMVPFFPWGEAADLYRFEANGIHYDSDQDLAAATLRHTISATKSATMIRASGKPSLGVSRWLEAEGRPGVAPPSDIYTDAAATNPAAASGLGSITVTYDDPRAMTPAIDDWATTECFVSTSSGFTTGPSNLAAIGRQTRFEINGLIPGTTYYSKLQIIDGVGNIAATSAQVSISTSEVGAYHQNLRSEIGSIVPNGEFAVTSLPALEATDPPDNWEPIDYASGTPVAIDGWGSAKEVYFDSTEANTDTADRALRIDNAKGTSADPGARSVEFVPINGGRPYVLDLAIKSATGSTSTAFLFRITWYKEDKTNEAGTSTVTGNGTIGSYIYSRNVVSAPVLARWAQFTVVKTAGIGAGIIYVDRFKMFRGNPAFLVYDSGGQSIPSLSTTLLNYDSESHDHGNNFLTDTFTAPETGDYAFAATNLLASMANGTYAVLSIYVNGAVSVQGARSYNGSGGSASVGVSVGVSSLRLTAGQLVTVRVFQSDSTARTASGSQYRFFFSGRRLQ